MVNLKTFLSNFRQIPNAESFNDFKLAQVALGRGRREAYFGS